MRNCCITKAVKICKMVFSESIFDLSMINGSLAKERREIKD
jgi:hypothetical protein